MRHQKSGRKFGRSASHRKAMFRTMVTNLLEHERIQTTEAKAKELRGVVERTITISLRLGDLLDKPKADRTREEHMRVVHAMREASKMIRTREVVHKLFDEIAPALKGRPGGYTRVIKLGQREGDGASMALIELVSRTDGAAAAEAS
ncbi:MAG: 50S ribosomal protein L17 [Nannocystaceae bacterium]